MGFCSFKNAANSRHLNTASPPPPPVRLIIFCYNLLLFVFDNLCGLATCVTNRIFAFCGAQIAPYATLLMIEKRAHVSRDAFIQSYFPTHCDRQKK